MSIRTGPPLRRRISAGLSVLSAAALAVLGVQAPAHAAAPGTPAPATAASGHTLFEPACPTAKKGEFTCFALRRTDNGAAKGLQRAAVAPGGFGAADLQSAYNLPDDGGAGRTVAIIDAYDDPNAEADMAVYRRQYGLPACTADSGCFAKVDQRGGSDYPTPDPNWAGEISLDLDMVSAAAPNARILLVEADDPSFENLGSAVDEAVALGAKYVSNSYGTDYRGGPGSGEDPSESTELDAFYNHPGVAVVASSGDYAYGVAFPAASQYVTSVGGTSLTRDASSPRGWSESAWNGAGSGCSMYEPKPSFQKDTGCGNRTVADVSAVSDPATGVAVYQTYGSGGWSLYGGTSAASPLVAAVYADAGTPVAGTYPNSYPYAASGAGINDVTSGANGACNASYLCTGGAGYDGPTGLGTPDGLAAFRTGPHGELTGTVTDTATRKPIPGATVSASGSSTHTDAKGAYSLSLPVGTYDVTVDAFGYSPGSATAVAVADGGTLTEDFALRALPSQTVSGKVTDGSGHGWPLYARITVDGVPGGPVWTDPATGAYRMTLPKGRDYTLHAAASSPGYEALTRTVTVGSMPQTADLALTADPQEATAPGYAVHRDGTTEPFDSTGSAPQGWSVVNAAGTTGGWVFDDPGARGNNTGGDGAFAVVDSDFAGSGEHQDSQLVSPVYDLTGKPSPEVSFATQNQTWTGQTATVDVTTDGGATWKTVWSTTSSVAGPATIEIPLTDYAGMRAVQLRFDFTAAYGYWWEVDNVFVGQRSFTPTPGGLVVGTVTDANTGAGTVGATVTGQDDPSATATTVATPDDPNLGDGFYSLFSPATGRRGFTAAKSHYTGLSRTVKVSADRAVAADFSLKAGRITVTPGSVSATVASGKDATQKLTVKNTGTAPASVTLDEATGRFQQAAQDSTPVRRIKGDYSVLPPDRQSGLTTTAAGPAAPSGADDSSWLKIPDYPTPIMDNTVGYDNGIAYSVFGWTGTRETADLYAYDPAQAGWKQLAPAPAPRETAAGAFINGKFYISGGWDVNDAPEAATDIYDPASNAWSTGAPQPQPHAASGSAVLDGKLYVVGGCVGFCATQAQDVQVYDPAANSWSTAASYPEPIAYTSCGAVDGRLYCAGGISESAEQQSAYVYNPGSDSWSPIADLPIEVFGAGGTAANGQFLVAGGVTDGGWVMTNQAFSYDPETAGWRSLPNLLSATFRAGSSPGFYVVGGQPSLGGPLQQTAEVLPGYDQVIADVAWLSEDSTHLVLQPGASAKITVTVDAADPSAAQYGVYTASITARTDTPYAVPDTAVTMRVTPPKSFGRLTGTVLAAGSDGAPAPLAGAVVQVATRSATYTLATARDGSYSLWLDATPGTAALGVFKDGYQPAVAEVRLKKGKDVTTDFVLETQ